MSDSQNKKSRRGAVEVFLTREFLSSLISVLDSFIAADESNKYSMYVERLKHKILTHGRKFTYNEEEQVVIYFYENEAALLMKLFTIYINAIEETSEDYFSEIGKIANLFYKFAMKKGFGNFPTAEQKQTSHGYFF